MTQSLPSFAAFATVVLAAASAVGQLLSGDFGPVTSQSQASDDRLISDMIGEIRSHDFISARIRHKVDLLGEQLAGTGVYLQSGKGKKQKIRLELKIQVAGQTTSIQHVCDGTDLWLHNDFVDKVTLTRIDVPRVLEAMDRKRPHRGQFEQVQLALCGLPKLLESLNNCFQFRFVQQDRLDGVLVDVLRGTWRPEALATTYPNPKAKKVEGEEEVSKRAAGKLPAHAPDVIVLLVGREDKFPYRIEFRRRVQSDENSPDQTDPTIPLVIMEWFEVSLDTPIDERQFDYRPGNLKDSNGTQKLLEQLGLAEEE